MRISDWSSDVCSSDLPPQKRLCRQVAKDKEQQAAYRIEEQDVAEPDQIEMREAEQREPDHAGIMRRRRAAPLRRGAFDDEQGAGAEQQREKPAHLGIDEHRSEEHTSELQSLMRISYAVFRLKK